MRIARLLVLLVNFAILAILAYAGVKIYFSDFFKQDPLTTVGDAGQYMPEKPVSGRRSLSEYESISGLAQKQIEVPPPIVTEVEETTPTLNVSIKSVVYDPKNPAKSGAHVEASGISRYLMVGDMQKVADNMPYHLKEIRENKPNKEWILVFEGEKGEIRQATYRME